MSMVGAPVRDVRAPRQFAHRRGEAANLVAPFRPWCAGRPAPRRPAPAAVRSVSATSSVVRLGLAQRLAVSSRSSAWRTVPARRGAAMPRKFVMQPVALRRQHAFRMKLHAFDRQSRWRTPMISPRVGLARSPRGSAGSVRSRTQRMVATDLERLRQACEHALPSCSISRSCRASGARRARCRRRTPARCTGGPGRRRARAPAPANASIIVERHAGVVGACPDPAR